MRAFLLLADSAQAVDGKLYILGGGWTQTGPQPTPFAIALKIEIPWDQANIHHEYRLQLEDADGRIVRTGQGDEGTDMVFAGGFEAGRPPGSVPGTSLDVPLALNFTPLPLAPGRYAWRLFINGETEQNWMQSFTVRPQQT